MNMHHQQQRSWLGQFIGDFVADSYLHDDAPYDLCVGQNRVGFSGLRGECLNVSAARRFAPAARKPVNPLIVCKCRSPRNSSGTASPAMRRFEATPKG